MIEIGYAHSFVLVGPTGERMTIATADLDDEDASDVLDRVADAIASRLLHPEEHQTVRDTSARALLRLEETPGMDGMAGERLPGNRLIRIFRHLAGQGPAD